LNRIKDTSGEDTDPGESQNVTDGAERLSGKQAERCAKESLRREKAGRDD